MNNDVGCRILSIMYCEFHPDKGPVIVFETGNSEAYISFEDIQSFVFPSVRLQNKVITLHKFAFRLIGCLRTIDHAKYERNSFLFNVCLLVTNDKTRYDELVTKLSRYLLYLETHFALLSNSDRHQNDLGTLLQTVHHELNISDCVHISAADFMIDLHLKVGLIDEPTCVCRENGKAYHQHNATGTVRLCDVPVRDQSRNEVKSGRNGDDLVTGRILSAIDGFSTMREIATKAKVAPNIAKCALGQQVKCGFVQTIPLFQYANRYCTTSKMLDLARSVTAKLELLVASKREGAAKLPSIRHTIRFLSYFSHGASVQDVLSLMNCYCDGYPACNGACPLKSLDERRCIQYSLTKGYIRYKRPVLLILEPTQGCGVQSSWDFDQLASECGLCLSEMLNFIASTSPCNTSGFQVLWH